MSIRTLPEESQVKVCLHSAAQTQEGKMKVNEAGESLFSERGVRG